MTIRQDKFQVGDKVQFVPEDEYIGTGTEERHRVKYGKGPYEVEEVEDATPLGAAQLILHSQLVTINGQTFTGYWFEPINRDEAEI